MKKIVYSVFCLSLCSISCDKVKRGFGGFMSNHNQSIQDTVLYSVPTKIIFKDTLIALGNIKEGVVREVVYHYQNAGTKPLLIFNVSPSCGCTIADYSHKPLAVGKWDSIVAKFDSKGKEGSYLKNIKVNCNSEQKIHNLAFSVNVTK